MKLERMEFQETAVDDLIAAFKCLWSAPGDMLPIVFKAPTGSGKTYMTEKFIQNLKPVGGFTEDIAWIWITISDELAMQSKNKFEEYFYPSVGRRLLTVADFSDGVLKRDDVLFLNWQKLVAKDADARILRRPEEKEKAKESGYYFEDVIEATHKDGRTIVMVIDESHQSVSPLALEKVIKPANPKVIIKASATPKDEPSASDDRHNRAKLVEVDINDVIEEGLIKEAIVSQTKEEIESGSEEKDLDIKLLDLAIKRRDMLREEWKKAGSNVNPLILVQLPNSSKDVADEVNKKKDMVLDYLKKRGVAEANIANWFDNDKDLAKLKFIAEPNSNVEFLLFKQAAGTGWDCPRAQIIVMYRDIKSPIFKTQTLGRILRNPEPDMDLRPYPSLRKGYLYTNYSASEVKAGAKDEPNNPILMKKAVLSLAIKEGEETILVHSAMTSDFVSRADYGDLGKASEFQDCFFKSMNKWFGICDGDLGSVRSSKVEAKGVNLTQSLKNSVLTNMVKQVDGTGNQGEDADDECSINDTERHFSAISRKILEEQTEEDAKVGNIARSESVFKVALRSWLKDALPDVASETGRYKIFLSDVAKGAHSIMLQAITAALKDYAPIRMKNVLSRKAKSRTQPSLPFLLKKTYEYSDDHEEYICASGVEPKLCAIKPFYLLPKYNGRVNETEFIDFLEGCGDKIKWWFKNGASGKDSFGLKYFNTTEKQESLFYPDWIVMFKDDRIGIFDTKAGMTAKNPEGREVGLNEKITSMNTSAGKDIFFGGLVVKEGGLWYCHDGKKYEYKSEGKLTSGWKPLLSLM